MADVHRADLRGSGFESGDLRDARLRQVVLNEEWHHGQYAERDLDALSARGT